MPAGGWQTAACHNPLVLLLASKVPPWFTWGRGISTAGLVLLLGRGRGSRADVETWFQTLARDTGRASGAGAELRPNGRYLRSGIW
jgi:hypothetical protein